MTDVLREVIIVLLLYVFGSGYEDKVFSSCCWYIPRDILASDFVPFRPSFMFLN